MSRLLVFLFSLSTSTAPLLAASGPQSMQVDFDYVKNRARTLSTEPYRPDDPPALPRALRELSYDDYREIEFRSEHALWGTDDDREFQLEFFHRGGLNPDRVTLHEASDSHVQEIPFVRDFFNYRGLGDVGRVRPKVGYAGFRIQHPLNRPDKMDELASFLGASYFRALAPGHHYGLSARGLALNAALPDHAEEFPRFTEFWLMKPAPDDATLRCYALLDSPSVTGAYAFLIEPGNQTTMTVEVSLWWREAVAHPGWAPLTSMYWFGENADRPAGEPRPEVHDSDGWWIETAEGERIWRPLAPATAIRVSEFPTTNPRRFGLLQRDRDFAHYQDLEAQYHRRPSAWVEPIGDWGSGRVRLSELPTDHEFADNIVAYWQPDQPVAAGDETSFAYRLVWADHAPAPATPLAPVIATRRATTDDQRTTWWIDFAGDPLDDHEPETFGADIVPGDHVTIVHQDLVRLPQDAGWRVVVVTEITGDSSAPATLRCTLRQGPDPISETWSNSWNH